MADLKPVNILIHGQATKICEKLEGNISEETLKKITLRGDGRELRSFHSSRGSRRTSPRPSVLVKELHASGLFK